MNNRSHALLITISLTLAVWLASVFAGPIPPTTGGGGATYTGGTNITVGGDNSINLAPVFNGSGITNIAATESAMVKLATFSTTTNCNVFSFTSIPTGYTMLYAFVHFRTTEAATESVNAGMTFNGDTATNYIRGYIAGNTIAAAATAKGQTTMWGGTPAGTNSGEFAVGSTEFHILNYSATNQYKTVNGTQNNNLNGTGNINSYVWFDAWLGTGAITSITWTAGSGVFMPISNGTLYGIR